ncbi:MAG: sulfotransferase [Candidatus Binatia bacterium]
MRRPDFFLVGAHKCGTTAMMDCLKQHPEVFVPAARKELDFFGSDLPFKRRRLSEEEYLAFFARATTERRAGESSPWYLYSTHAALEIKAFSPSARILIMLRSPVDMMYYLHSQRVYNGNEDIEDFETALAAEEERLRGLRLPQKASDDFGCFYRDVARYSKQVERYFTVFGKDHVHVILTEAFARHPGPIYRGVCRFLDVDWTFQPVFRILNSRKRIRSEALRNLLRRPHPTSDWLFRALQLRPDRNGGYKGWLRRLNSTSRALRPLDGALRERLQLEFEPEVRRLGELLGRDLSHWCAR